MTVVRTNLPTWFQDNGEPLLNGYIYVGDANQDPRSFPKTVTFQDSQGNQFPATQPLRTNGDGRIQWNGKAVIATVTGNYSLRIEDSSQQLIENGYIPFVEDENGGASVDLTDYCEYKLTLAEIKTLNKAPGQVVSSVGKTSSGDDEGAYWLVVNNTGNPADDDTLIDFANGNQGQRITNPVHPEIAGFTRASTVYVQEDGDRSSGFDVVSTLLPGNFYSIGPTGSGATHIWSDLDVLPDGVKFLKITARIFADKGSTPATAVTSAQFRRTGSSVAVATALTATANVLLPTVNIDQVITFTTLEVPVDSEKRFDAQWSTFADLAGVQIYLNGFGM